MKTKCDGMGCKEGTVVLLFSRQKCDKCNGTGYLGEDDTNNDFEGMVINDCTVVGNRFTSRVPYVGSIVFDPDKEDDV